MSKELNKSILTESAHIYVDDATGDEYIFDGKKLVKIKDGSPRPSIGDRGNSDEEAEEDARREKQAAEERAESGEQGETEEEKQRRLDKIKQFLDDGNIGSHLSGESEAKVKDEKKRKKAAADKELIKNLKGADKNIHVIKELSNDLRKFLAKELGKPKRVDTWRKYNANYHDSGIIRPGHREEKVGKIPVIQIYIDQSASWSEEEVKMAQNILLSIKEFETKHLIRSEVYYFANHIHSDAASARREGGTGAGTELIEQLNSMKPENVIVITDGDFDGWGLSGKYTAPGGVWLVFRKVRSQLLIDSLHGKLVTKYYDIDEIY